jgi:hypothetical protein
MPIHVHFSEDPKEDIPDVLAQCNSSHSITFLTTQYSNKPYGSKLLTRIPSVPGLSMEDLGTSIRAIAAHELTHALIDSKLRFHPSIILPTYISIHD